MSDEKGNITLAVRSGATEDEVVRGLAAEGLYVLSVRETAGEAGAHEGRGSFSIRAVGDFTESIALMIRAGLSVRDSLEIAASVFPPGRGRGGQTGRLVAEINRMVASGRSFADTIIGLGKSFPPVYRGLVRIGERVGTLEGVLTRLSAYLADQKRMRDKVAGAMVYPLLVLAVALGGMITVAAVVVPKAQELFVQVGTNLPESVKGIAASARTFLVVVTVLVAAAVGIAVATRILRRRGGRAARLIDAFVLRTPGLGQFLAVREMVNITFALETLVENGVTLEDAFSEASLACGNFFLRFSLQKASEDLVRGISPSQALLARPAFPERMGRWVVIGERTGHVERVFGQLRLFYQSEFEKWTQKIMNLVEPALIVAVGIVLLFMILTFVVPLFSLYGSIIP